MKLLSCALQEDGTYRVSVLLPNNMVETFEACSFQELRFRHQDRNLELHLQTLGIRHADSFETIRTSSVELERVMAMAIRDQVDAELMCDMERKKPDGT